jgi:type III restriction enzyme
MKFTLKDYQNDGVRAVLERLTKARRRWREEREKNAFSLTAATGAGKTVMAAAVFEALFFGNEDYDFEADPGAVVIWFSDDPSLNEQSRWRLMEASDKLNISDLVAVGNTFSREIFDAGKIYFLNTQKLSKKSLLVRGSDPDDDTLERDEGDALIPPDGRAFTIWDTIRNTIEASDRTLYLVLDEAHRGMKEGGRGGDGGRPTIVRQLINGTGSVPGIPVVWGVSATVERFDKAIKGMKGHAILPNVTVDPRRVQESGLLKDTINLDVSDDTGDVSTVLLRRGTDKLREISEAWSTYAKAQGEREAVVPLMVFQVPNSPRAQDIAGWLDVIFERWPELPYDSVGNVFGEHRTETFGRYSVPYVAPERVQQSTRIQILLAKDAISTGWDCPRAEVMVSFRAASDRTHITQLLGRMVRTPLARRIPGNERLNAVDCVLPFFNTKTVEAVVTALLADDEEGGGFDGRRVLVNPVEMAPNPDVPSEVWDKFLSLPSQAKPRKDVRQVKRLTSLAHELAFDSLLPGAGKKAHAQMHRALDAARSLYAEQISTSRSAVLEVLGKTLRTDVDAKDMSFDDFVEAADLAVVEEAYRHAARILSPDLVRSYSEYLAQQATGGEITEDALVDAHTTVAALGLVPDVRTFLEIEAEKLASQWLNQFRIPVKGLKDERQEVYRELAAMSVEPQDISLALPRTRLQPTTFREANGDETPLPRFEKHLLCGADRLFPERFNSWEKDVIAEESKREGFVAWYRNPSQTNPESLGVAYGPGDDPRIMRPDFIFFARSPSGEVVADIVDPHSFQYEDALPKLKGLADYAASARGDAFRRIEAVAKIGAIYRVLDLKEKSVRDAIARATSVSALYSSAAGADYLV